MPAGMRQNMASGMCFWDLIADELPSLCRQWFPISEAREAIFGPGLERLGKESDLLHLTSTFVEAGKPMPRFYQWCETGDLLYKDSAGH